MNLNLRFTNKYIIRGIISIFVLIIIVPIIVNYGFLWWHMPGIKGDIGDWLSFLGSYLGSIFGGIIGAIVAVFVAIYSINTQHLKAENSKLMDIRRENLGLLIDTKANLDNLKNELLIFKQTYQSLTEKGTNPDEAIVIISKMHLLYDRLPEEVDISSVTNIGKVNFELYTKIVENYGFFNDFVKTFKNYTAAINSIEKLDDTHVKPFLNADHIKPIGKIPDEAINNIIFINANKHKILTLQTKLQRIASAITEVHYANIITEIENEVKIIKQSQKALDTSHP